MDKFVFISYKSDDRDLIRPYLELLEQNGISYWWDQMILKKWGAEIGQKLEECSVVVGFISESAMKSRGVHKEIEFGSSQDKLLPVRLDPSRLNYEFDTAIGTFNWIDLSLEEPDKLEQEKKRFVSRVAALLGGVSAPVAIEPESAAANLEQWFASKDRQAQIAYIIALCVFERYNHDFILNCAALLERELAESGLDEMLGFNTRLTTRSSKLRSICAHSRSYRSRVTASMVDIVMFDDPQLREKAFLYIWDELDQLRYPIIRWINRLLATRPADCVGDIAGTLSLVARRNFQSIYALILRPWLARTWSAQFMCADITLSLLMDDPGIKKFITNELLQVGMETVETEVAQEPAASPVEPPANGNDTPEGDSEVGEFSQQLSRRSAIALVTGYAGMRMPDLSVALFKRIDGEFETDSASRQGSTLHCVHQGIDYLLIRARTDAYARSLPLAFAEGIHGWMGEDGSSRKTVLPEYIFLSLLAKLTLSGAGAGGTHGAGLRDVLTEDDTLDTRAIDTFGSAIARALESRNTFIRDKYIVWMKAWKKQIGERAREEENTDPTDLRMEKQLFAAVFEAASKHASTDNDVDRIAYHTTLS